MSESPATVNNTPQEIFDKVNKLIERRMGVETDAVRIGQAIALLESYPGNEAYIELLKKAIEKRTFRFE